MQSLNNPRDSDDIPSDASIETYRQAVRKQQAAKKVLLQQLRHTNRELVVVSREKEDSNEEICDSLKKEIQSIARKFTYMNMLWLRSSDMKIFNLEVNPNYNDRNRFKSVDDQQQGILAELRAEIPRQWYGQMGRPSFIRTFISEMSQARSNACSRMRQVAGPYGCLNLGDLINSPTVEERTEKLEAELGLIVSPDGVKRYNSLPPILYKDEPMQKDKKWKIFRNPILMKTYSALLRGANSVRGLAKGEITQQFNHVTNESMWGVQSVTPAAIAMSCIMTRWAASNDATLQPKGSRTKIDYQQDYEFYLKYLHRGLHKQVPSVLDIFETWNRVFYPHVSRVVKIVPSMAEDGLKTLMGDLEEEIAEEKERRAGEVQKTAQVVNSLRTNTHKSSSLGPKMSHRVFSSLAVNQASGSRENAKLGIHSKREAEKYGCPNKRKRIEQDKENENENTPPKPSKQQRKSKRIARQ